jgi:hypothetical protein
MRSLRCAGLLVLVISAAVAAFASPLFATWKAELNGQPVTVVVDYVDHQVVGKMIVGTGASAREFPMVNPKILDAPPMKMRFQLANVETVGKVLPVAAKKGATFELNMSNNNNDEATLRIVDENGEVTAVKATKQR